jgi:hypothetical protein
MRLVCGREGYGHVQTFIRMIITDPVTCHETCLADPKCMAFQISLKTNDFCNLYDDSTEVVNTRNPDDHLYIFYDKNCPDHLQ